MMKENDENKFELRPTISPRDIDLRNKVGVGVWLKIKNKTFRNNGFKCCGCGFEPYEVSAETVLDAHLIKEDIEFPENSEFRTTCLFCHMIEHADVAIGYGYVKLVNSHFSQGELVNICRHNNLSNHIEDGSVRYLKKTFDEYLEELKSGKAFEGKIKLVFTEEYVKSIIS